MEALASAEKACEEKLRSLTQAKVRASPALRLTPHQTSTPAWDRHSRKAMNMTGLALGSSVLFAAPPALSPFQQGLPP